LLKNPLLKSRKIRKIREKKKEKVGKPKKKMRWGVRKEIKKGKKKKGTYWPTLGRESWTGTSWGGVGRGLV